MKHFLPRWGVQRLADLADESLTWQRSREGQDIKHCKQITQTVNRHKIDMRMRKPQLKLLFINLQYFLQEAFCLVGLDTKQRCQTILCLKDAYNSVLTILTTGMYLDSSGKSKVQVKVQRRDNAQKRVCRTLLPGTTILFYIKWGKINK